MRARVLAAALLSTQATADAFPVDRDLSLAPGELHAERVRYLTTATVEPTDLAKAELLPAGELLVTPLRAGEGLLYLFEEGQLEVVRLRVTAAPSVRPPMSVNLPALHRDCPDAELLDVRGDALLRVGVSTPECRSALRVQLNTAGLLTGQLRLELTPEVLQAQLLEASEVLVGAGISGLELSYTGATLTLRGTIDPATRQRALVLLWPHVVGSLGFDDQTNETHLPESAHAR